jgi:glycosyltransferase involved in cell wall biosynthesis
MRPITAPKCLHLWVPELSGVGGIQHYSRILLRGLKDLLPKTQIRVLSKNDSHFDFPPRKGTSFRSTGAVPGVIRTARFCSLLMEQTLIQRPDLAIITHLHFAPAAYVLKRLFGLRYWVSAHGLEAWGPMSRLLRRALRNADRILSVSRHTQQRMVETQRLDPARFFVLPNAVKEEVFFPTGKPIHLLRRYGLEAGQKILFTLARLDSPDRYKGYDRVIDSLDRIRRMVPDVHYILSGRGAENKRIRRRVRRLGLQQHVTLTGFLPDRDLRDHYNLCDLFVMPSQGEGFGIVYLEALACGRPVLAGNEDGSREPLLGGELGALVNPQDQSALTERIVDLLLARSPSDRFYDTGYLRRRTIEHFGFEAFKERLGRLLKS